VSTELFERAAGAGARLLRVDVLKLDGARVGASLRDLP